MASAALLPQGASYQPSKMLREVAVDARQTAVLFIDVQNYNCHKGGAMYHRYTPEDLEGPDFAYWWSRIDECTHKWVQLQQAARACKIEVMYTVIQSLTADGRERSLDYKISGFHVPPGCWDAKVLDAVTPGPDEVVLPKTSSSVFNSTTLDYILRNMDKRFLIIAGCVTDQCVVHAVKDAADLGYLVTLVEDCCATFSPERHIEACKAVAGYCRQRTLTTLLQEFMTVMAKSGAAYLPPGGPGDGHGGQPGSGGLDNGGHGGGKLPGGAGSGAYGVGSAGAGGLGGGTGLDSEAGVGGGGTAAGYKRDYEAMIEQERDGRHSGDNFSPGLGGPDQSGDHDGGDDDGEGGVRSVISGGTGSAGVRSRGGTGGTSRRQAGRGRSRTHWGGSDSSKKVYFEYAKLQWESEREFMLPNGLTWVEVGLRGDPQKSERGVVFCRLCRHYNKGNVFGKGYRAGKRSALKEHMQTKDHKELVEALEAGIITMPSHSSLPMQPPPLPMLSPAAAAALDGQRRSYRQQQQQQQQIYGAERLTGDHELFPGFAAAEYLDQLQQQQQHGAFDWRRGSSPAAAAAAAAAAAGGYESLPGAEAAAAALLQMGSSPNSSRIAQQSLLQHNTDIGNLASHNPMSAATAGDDSALNNMAPQPLLPPQQQYGAQPLLPPGDPAAAAAAAARGGVIQITDHTDLRSSDRAVDLDQQINPGSSSTQADLECVHLAQMVARIAAAAGLSTEGLSELTRHLQDPDSDLSGLSAEQVAAAAITSALAASGMSADQAAAAITSAFAAAAQQAGLDDDLLKEALSAMSATPAAPAAAGEQQQQNVTVLGYGPAAAGAGAELSQQQHILPQEQQQQVA